MQSGEFVETVNFGTGVAKINLICLVVSQEENETSAKQEEKEIIVLSSDDRVELDLT